MAFHFSLQALLRFRQGIERQTELRLIEASHQVALARRQISAVNDAMVELSAREARQLDSGVTAAELQFDELCRSALIVHRQQLEMLLAQCEKVRLDCSRAFQEARRKREVVDILRRHQLQAYRQLERRNAQRHLDEMFLLRREFLRRK